MLAIFIIYLLPIILIIYAPFFMPNWRWFLLLCIAYGVAGFGVWFGVAHYKAADVPRFLVFSGNMWLDAILPFLPFTIIARAIVLVAKYWGMSGWKLVGLNTIAICALPAFYTGTYLMHQWDKRPASVACTSKQLPIQLAGLRGTIPWSETIKMYLGANIKRDARYLFSQNNRRNICRQTDNGIRSLPIEAITIGYSRFGRALCDREGIQPWERYVCATSTNKKKEFSFLGITFFQPEGIKLGEFGIRGVGADGKLIPRRDEHIFSSTHPTFGVVEFACRKQSNNAGTYYCESRFSLTDFVDVNLNMKSSITDIDENTGKALSISKAICSGIFDQPTC